ncbi:MAG: hypothetical protein ACLGI2_16190 [Acidimicrobiia bacterium]
MTSTIGPVQATRWCEHDPVEAAPGDFAYELTATDHVVGALYFSPDHGMHYRVQSSATIWDLAPGHAVAVEWENGNRTVMSRERGRDKRCRPTGDAPAHGR